MGGQGYDVREMANVFVTLERVERRGRARAACRSGPPRTRTRATAPRRRASGPRRRRSRRSAKVERERYLAMLGGMVFGDDPRQGFFQGDAFLHPAMKFQMEFPQGWKAQNTAARGRRGEPEAGRDGPARRSPGKLSPEEATKKFFQQEGVKPLQAPQTGDDRRPARDGALLPGADGAGRAERHRLVRLARRHHVPARRLHAGAGLLRATTPRFKQVISSFGPLTDKAAEGGASPRRSSSCRVPRDMTIAEFNAQFPSTVPVERRDRERRRQGRPAQGRADGEADHGWRAREPAAAAGAALLIAARSSPAELA